MVQFKILVKLFKAFVKCFAELKDEMIIVVKKTQFEICAMDGSHIALVHAQLESSEFIEYTIEKEFNFCFNAKKLKEYFKTLKAENLTLTIDLVKKTYLIEAIQNGINTQFTDKLLDLEYEEINMNSLNSMEYDNQYNISLELLNQIVNLKSEIIQIKQINDALQFIMNEQKITINNSARKDSEIQFSTQFMKKLIIAHSELFNKQSKLFKNATIELNYRSEAPLKAIVKFEQYKFAITYFIAPRVEEDPEEEESEEVKEVKAKIESEKDNLLASIYSKEQIVAFLMNEKLHLQVVDSELKDLIYRKKNIIQSRMAGIEETNNLFAKYYTESDLIDLAKVKFTRLTEKAQLEKDVIDLTINSDQTIKDLIEVSNELSHLNQ
jgi:DNA polymerase III sliding clamp (beta) subunit (PCNA family)